MFERITLPNHVLPPPGPFCHAVRAGDFLFVTGQTPEDPATGEALPLPFEQQVHRVMDNLKLVLDQAGTHFDCVVMARIFVTDIRHISTVNAIYPSYFSPRCLPGRTTVGVTGLAGLADVEIDLIVYCGDG
jgi:2-iminobutanoate/2-iminopropanoate deaminase